MSDREQASDPFEKAFLNEYPNPDRIGCPGDEILRGLASKKLPISHPARMHISQCSPCWREFRSFQAEIKRTRRWRLIGGIAALLVLFLGSSLYWFEGQRRSDPIIALDLRSIDPTRGNDQQHLTVHLPRRVFRLVVTLPFGLSSGVYELQLRDSNDLIAAKARGTATITDGDTCLKVDRMDLSSISKGDYLLILAHGSDRLKADVTVP